MTIYETMLWKILLQRAATWNNVVDNIVYNYIGWTIYWVELEVNLVTSVFKNWFKTKALWSISFINQNMFIVACKQIISSYYFDTFLWSINLFVISLDPSWTIPTERFACVLKLFSTHVCHAFWYETKVIWNVPICNALIWSVT